MKTQLLFALLALSACSAEHMPAQSQAPAVDVAAAGSSDLPAATAPVLSWDGYGPLRFGMNIAEAETALATTIDSNRALDPACDYIAFAALPGMRFMVENGVITRGEAGADIENTLDISVGAELSVVVAAYPQAEVTPHKYDEAGHYIVFSAPARDRAVVMESHTGRVTLIRAGLEPAVRYVESCL